MLTAQENELLCRVGPGTPMGELMRQYWLPAYASHDVEADGAPIRVRLLGENLLGLRTTSGRVGLVSDVCPHRCTSLFLGRNEEEGLRCVYHGWKFDVDGRCVDQPGEPEDSRFESRTFLKAYPCIERNGVVWTYMGPRTTPPPLPDVEANMQAEPPTHNRTLRQCNWLQALEGDIDTVHSEYLHSPARIKAEDLKPGTGGYYRHRLRKPLQLHAIDTEFGTSYGAHRPAEEDTTYWRIAHFLFPFYTLVPSPSVGSRIEFRMWVPSDDEHTLRWIINARTNSDRAEGAAAARQPNPNRSDTHFDFLPDTTDWLGRFRPAPRAENDWLISREDQKTIEFTGLRGGAVIQDQAVTEAMGPILDRTAEHLGHSDMMIIRTRQRLSQALKAFRENGTIPPGVDNPEVYRTRSGWLILPNGVDWWEGSKELRQTFVAPREESEALAALRR
jgi:phenylpropionate dioxygenase-like ring-hydroxylating dioxygenase large terminal subunit